MKVIAYDPYINETAAQELNVTPVTLEQLLKEAQQAYEAAEQSKEDVQATADTKN